MLIYYPDSLKQSIIPLYGRFIDEPDLTAAGRKAAYDVGQTTIEKT